MWEFNTAVRDIEREKVQSCVVVCVSCVLFSALLVTRNPATLVLVPSYTRHLDRMSRSLSFCFPIDRPPPIIVASYDDAATTAAAHGCPR